MPSSLNCSVYHMNHYITSLRKAHTMLSIIKKSENIFSRLDFPYCSIFSISKTKSYRVDPNDISQYYTILYARASLKSVTGSSTLLTNKVLQAHSCMFCTHQSWHRLLRERK